MNTFGYRRISENSVEILLDGGRSMQVTRQSVMDALENAKNNPDCFTGETSVGEYVSMWMGALKELDKPMKTANLNYRPSSASLFSTLTRKQ